MKALAICAAATLLISTPALGQEAAIDRLIDSAGLESLQGQERDAARALVRRLLANRSSSDTLTNSAKEYMESEGYEPIYLSTASVRGEDYLLARSSFATYATKDIPFGISPMLFRSGEYFAKTNPISGGVSEFIDQNGRVQRLMFAEWTLVR